MFNSMEVWLKIVYVIFSFCSALVLGAIKCKTLISFFFFFFFQFLSSNRPFFLHFNSVLEKFDCGFLCLNFDFYVRVSYVLL